MAAQGKTGQDSAARNWRWATATMFLVNGFIVGSWASQIPLLLPRHHITESTLGLLIFGLGVGAVGAMVLVGGLIGRFGSRTVLRSFALATSLALAAVSLAANIWVLALTMVVMGALIGCMDVSMNVNAVELERRLGRAIMSSCHGFWSFGGFIGAIIGGWIISWLGAEGHAIVVAGLALGSVLLALPYLLGEPASTERHMEDRAAKGWPRNWAIYVLGLMAFCSMIPEGAVLDWAAIYLQKEHAADASTSTLAFALFSATMATVRFAGDGIRNKFGAVQTLRASALVAASGLMGAALAPDAILAIACFTFAGLGVANMVPVMFSAAGNHPGLRPGLGISIVTMLGYSGILFAPSSIGYAAENIGFRTTFAALGLMLIVVALMARRAAAADFKG